MCGIFGGVLNVPVNKNVIQESLNTLAHRGPDDSGIYVQAPVFLGNRRLSIIDLSGGHQPVLNEDNSVVVVFNGEIYNYLELIVSLESRGHVFRTRSDTECLVHLWEDYGTGMCSHLRGMFAFAIWDTSKKSLFLARDRYGKKPLFYNIINNKQIVFSSEIKALKFFCNQLGEELVIRDQGIYDYLSIGAVPQPFTVFENTFAVPPASWLLLKNGIITIEPYWALGLAQNGYIQYDDLLQHTRANIAESVRLRLRSDVPVAIFLSGGIDSAVVAYEASRQTSSMLQAITISIPDQKFDETQLARLSAKHLNVKHRTCQLAINPTNDLCRIAALFDQPFADPSAIPTLLVSEQARQYAKVVLSGDGGDEVFGGYRRYLASFLMEKYGLISRVVGEMGLFLDKSHFDRRSWFGLALRMMNNIRLKGGERYISITTDMCRETDKNTFWHGQKSKSTESWIEEIFSTDHDCVTGLMHADSRINLLSVLLVKMDMCSMAASLEVRSPFLDHVLAEQVSKIPRKLLFEKFRTKSLLRDAYHGLLPSEVLHAPKKGFEIPLERFLKNDWKEILQDTVLSGKPRINDYIDPEFVSELALKKSFQNRNWSYIMYALLILELWLRENG